MIIKPHNPVYLICSLFLPWRWGKTNVMLTPDQITLNRYYCQSDHTMKFQSDSCPVLAIQMIGFPVDCGVDPIEPDRSSRYGCYVSQELVLCTGSGYYAFNMRPYTRSDILSLIQTITTMNPQIILGKRLRNTLRV